MAGGILDQLAVIYHPARRQLNTRILGEMMLDRLRQGGYWLVRGKINLIDRAFTSCRIESFADLGAVWGVEGAYTFRALDKYPVKEAVLVDGRITPTVAARANSYPQLRVIEGNFEDQEIADKVGNVDALFLFDVLLHQVSPDWDTILDMYAKNVRCLLIYNQQWIGSTTTVRLLDLGEKHYFRNVPHSKLNKAYRDLFQKLDKKHPDHDKPWRDIPDIWQWGITDADLESKASELGFKLLYKEDCRGFGWLPNIQNRAFLFARQ